MEREYLLTVLSLCRQVVSLWTCSKLCTFFFVAGVFVGYTLKRRVRSWASKLLRKLRDDWYCPVSHLYIFPNLMLLLDSHLLLEEFLSKVVYFIDIQRALFIDCIYVLISLWNTVVSAVTFDGTWSIHWVITINELFNSLGICISNTQAYRADAQKWQRLGQPKTLDLFSVIFLIIISPLLDNILCQQYNIILYTFYSFVIQKYSLWNSKRVDVRWVSSCDSFFNSFANTGIPQ